MTRLRACASVAGEILSAAVTVILAVLVVALAADVAGDILGQHQRGHWGQ